MDHTKAKKGIQGQTDRQTDSLRDFCLSWRIDGIRADSGDNHWSAQKQEWTHTHTERERERERESVPFVSRGGLTEFVQIAEIIIGAHKCDFKSERIQ